MSTAPEVENWKDVPGYEGRYRVSDLGRVFSLLSNKVLACALEGRGYPLVMLTPGRKFFRVHCLVMHAFVGPCPQGQVVRHKQKPNSNCRLDNLEYGTQKQNMADKKRHGTHLSGVQIHCSKLTAEQVEDIRKDSRVQHIIALDYGVHQSVISRIKTRSSWYYV